MELVDLFEEALEVLFPLKYVNEEYVRVELFTEHGINPELEVYTADELTINQGDFVALGPGGYIRKAREGDEPIGKVV